MEMEIERASEGAKEGGREEGSAEWGVGLWHAVPREPNTPYLRNIP